jgi:hypothetical protein
VAAVVVVVVVERELELHVRNLDPSYLQSRTDYTP